MRPTSYSKRQLARDAALTTIDMEEVRRCRRPHNRLGFAYQVGFVRLHNRFPNQDPLERIEELLVYTGVQVGLSTDLIDAYEQRQQTLSEHQQRISQYLGLRRFGTEEIILLEAFLFDMACRLEQSAALTHQAQTFLKEQGILQPADAILRRLVGAQRKRAQTFVCEKIAAGLPQALTPVLDDLLAVPSGEVVSALHRIKANPNKPSAEAMLALMDKLATIEASGVLEVDVSWLNGNYQRALFHYVDTCSVDRLREVIQPRRTAALVCFLWQSYRDAVDQAVDMFDKLITRIHTQAQNHLDEQMKQQRRLIRASLSTLKTLGTLILDTAVTDAELRAQVFQAVSKETLTHQVEALDEWVSGKKSDLFYEVVKHFGYLRRFTPTLLGALEFVQEVDGPTLSCMTALETLKALNIDQRRKLPDEVVTDFIPQRLRPIVEEGGTLNKRAWECALLVAVRDEIKAGNISVAHSKRFGHFDDFFMDNASWAARRAAFFSRSEMPEDPRQVAAYLRQRLDVAYDQFLASAPENSFATIDKNGWQLATDPAEKKPPEEHQQLKQLKSILSQQMRRIKLPELLIEVDNELNFTRHFAGPTPPAERPPDRVRLTLAALMAHGCNIGPYTMAQLVQDISYKQLKRVSDWQLTEDAQRSALAVLVNAISALDTALHWGDGRSSASDGQRFGLPRKVLQQTYSPKFSDFALEFYTFLADNFAPFYSMPIECTDRDAAFVLDGLLYNESELDLEEHYTDTHGYTEINFAAFGLLGRRFCPRIRGLKHQHIYCIDRDRDYGALMELLRRADRTIDVSLIVEQWDRMGQFYASFESGHTTASVALKRLAAFSPKHHFYRANRELGRVLKTEFILSYMSQPQLRARIRRGLLKVEQLHALARDVYYGRRGRINARELHEQLNACSCLTLILACIIYWQAKEINRVIKGYDLEKEGIEPAVVAHISPIEWDNVVLYGDYVLNKDQIR